MIESALRYRVQAPMIDQVLKEIGIEGGSLAKMGGLMREARDMQRVAKEAGRQAEGGAAAARGRHREPPAARDEARPRIDPMARVYVSSVIDAPAAKVWARVRDFNGLPGWHPAIAESRIENGEPSDKVGCVRNFRAPQRRPPSASGCWAFPTTTCSAPTRSWNRRWPRTTTSRRCG